MNRFLFTGKISAGWAVQDTSTTSDRLSKILSPAIICESAELAKRIADLLNEDEATAPKKVEKPKDEAPPLEAGKTWFKSPVPIAGGKIRKTAEGESIFVCPCGQTHDRGPTVAARKLYTCLRCGNSVTLGGKPPTMQVDADNGDNVPKVTAGLMGGDADGNTVHAPAVTEGTPRQPAATPAADPDPGKAEGQGEDPKPQTPAGGGVDDLAAALGRK